MSFLNPVNEPVLRFSSTDADAPQINYNARTAGDVKAVLKACLVTGYGATASAGWSIVNEIDHVAEFVSPSAAMSDYRLGIDDTSASSTTWYYQYQDVRVNPVNNNQVRNFDSYANKSSPDNHWQLLVTARGLVFIDFIAITGVTGLVSRFTYWGAIKSAITDTNTRNISYWCVGANAPVATPPSIFNTSSTNTHHIVGAHSGLRFASTNIAALGGTSPISASNIELISDLFLENSQASLIGKQPAVMTRSSVAQSKLFDVTETTAGGRSLLNIAVVYLMSKSTTLDNYAKHLSIYTDYWEY